jgi:hypothetical protein
VPTPTNTRSQTFRYVYANGYTLQISGNDVCIRFGINEDPGQPNTILEEIGVYMTLTSAKLLAGVLTDVIKRFEKDNKITVPLSQNKLDSVLKGMVVSKRPSV